MQTLLKKNISDTSNYQQLVFGHIETPNYMDQIKPEQIIGMKTVDRGKIVGI